MKLNPNLNFSALAQAYAENGRLQVRDVMRVGDAEEAFSMLLQTPWSVVFNEGKTVHRLSPDQVAAIPQDQVAHLMGAIGQRAANQFQFLYEYDPIFVRYFAQDHPPMPIFRLYEFLNSPATLSFFRTLTGLPDIKWADAQATLYRPGHFLKCHDDINVQEKRLAAYVLSFTKDWEKDWGGYLQFFDDHGNVVQGIRPAFNAVSVFTVPVAHGVEMVTPFAPGLRLSVTGWLRADEPPGHFRKAAGA